MIAVFCYYRFKLSFEDVSILMAMRNIYLWYPNCVHLFLKAKEERVAIQWPPHLILIAQHRAHFKRCLNIRSAAHEGLLRNFFELVRGLPGTDELTDSLSENSERPL